MAILVTGGAGYIGSHVVRELQKSEKPIVVIDDLSTGYLSRLQNVEFVNLDLSNPYSTKEIAEILVSKRVDSVIHLAAKKSAPESVMNPGFYFHQNLTGLINLCNATEGSEVSKFVFSSSCSVYGDAKGVVDESFPKNPVSPYGLTKLFGEEILKQFSKVGRFKLCNLRYFNVAGADSKRLADLSVSNLIPLVVKAVLEGRKPLIFGDNYDTPDGTCVRDYIHVSDLARAHLDALNYLETCNSNYEDFNVGTGLGYSVLQVIEEVLLQTNSETSPIIEPRRVGDPSQIVSNISKSKKMMGFESKLSLSQMVSSTISSFS